MTNDAKPTSERPQPRFAPGPLGRGVYLSDLVRWLMEKHEATRVHVVKEYLCPVMLEKQPLFGDVKRSGDATPISDGAEWSMTVSGYVEKVTPKSGKSLRTVRTGVNRLRVERVTVNTESVGKGVDAAVKWLLDRWGFDRNADAIMDNDTRASWLAVSEADARRCWGWGKDAEAAPAVDAVAKPAEASPKPPTTWAELVSYHKANPGHLWTVELKNIVATERGVRKDQKGAAVAMGAELGFKGAERVNSLVRTKDQHGKRKTIEHQRTRTR